MEAWTTELAWPADLMEITKILRRGIFIRCSIKPVAH
jgi:hypothetical protein